jgi:hypothetical protein
MRRKTFLRVILVMLLCVNLAIPPGLMAQEANQGGPAFRPEEIDQLLAPIALYPDALLAQVLTSSTYPLEIVQAGRFVQQNKDLKGDKLLAAAKDKDWEPSVKAMLSFPDVLLMMNDQLEWTEKLGNAFLGQQKDVMASVQRLRKKAQQAGNLKTTKEQKVVVEPQTQYIVIESPSPQVVYVPTYNTTVVYGTWAYPAYPPPPVYPPSYVAGTALVAFGVGVAVGAAASGYGAWGCGWGHNDVTVNYTQQNNFTKNNYNNAQKYQVNPNNKNQSWQHNPEHRKGAQYPNQATAQKYGQQRAATGARPTATSGAGGLGAGTGAQGAGRPQTSDMSRGGAGAGGAKPQTADLSRGGAATGSGKPQTSAQQSAFSGSGNGGSERASSNRGQESRSSMSGGGASPSSSMSRGGGGASPSSSMSGGSSSRSSGGASRSSGGGGRGGGGRR